MLAAVAVAVCPNTALAADRQGAEASFPIGLEWERAAGAETCIPEAALRRSVENLLQRRTFAPVEQTAVVIRGRVAPTDGQRFRARLLLVVGDGSVVGQRVLESETSDCASLNRPLSLVIALAVDSLRALPRSTLRLEEHRAPTWFEAGPAVFYESAMFPVPMVGGGADARLHLPSFLPIDAGIFVWPVSTSAIGSSGPGAKFLAFTGRLGVCPALALGASAELRACVDAQAGGFRAEGVSVDISKTTTNWMIGAHGRLALWWQLGRAVALEPSVGAFFPFIRYRFTYADETGQERAFYDSPRASLMLEIAMPVRIP